MKSLIISHIDTCTHAHTHTHTHTPIYHKQAYLPGHEVFLHLRYSSRTSGQVDILVDGQTEGGARDVQAPRVAVVVASTLAAGVGAVGEALASASSPNGCSSFRKTEWGVIQVDGAHHLRPCFAVAAHLLMENKGQPPFPFTQQSPLFLYRLSRGPVDY